MRETATIESLNTIADAITNAGSARQFLSRFPAELEKLLGVKNTVIYYRDEATHRYLPQTASAEAGSLIPLESESELIASFSQRHDALFLEERDSIYSQLITSTLHSLPGLGNVNLVIPLHCGRSLRGLLLTRIPGDRKKAAAIVAAVRVACQMLVPVIEVQHLNLVNDQNYYRLFRFDHLVQIGQMVAEITHELRTPLNTALLEFAEIVDQLDEDSELRQSYRKIQGEIVRVNGLIDSLLNFSRFREITLEPVDLDAFVKTAVNNIPRKRFPAHCQIRLEPAEKLIVTTDANRLLQVFLNVVSNAFEAAGENGVITIAVGRDNNAAASRCFIVIQDNGPGIADEIRSQIAQPFFTTKPQGTGLGLFNSVNIIKSLNGDLEIHSTPQGTRVRLLLPEEN